MSTGPGSVVVVGGGISGLTAAWRAHIQWPSARITVLESADRLGGCLLADTLDGTVPEGADVGAEASLYVRPETRELAAELGLEVVYPDRTQSSQLYVHDSMHTMPARTLMGVPSDPDALAGILAPADVERVRHERLTAPAAGDVAVGEFLAARLGDAVVDQMIDPLIGGVYSGRCRDLSMAATVPALLPAAATGTAVLDTVADTLAARTATKGANVPGTQAQDAPPVFMSLRGGINHLADALAEHLSAAGVRLRLRAPVQAIRRAAGGWLAILAGPASTPDDGTAWPRDDTTGEAVVADALILAVPAYTAASLLRTVDAAATVGDRPERGPAERVARRLEVIPYADSALVTTVLRLCDAPLRGSGFLVPPSEGTFIKASTFASNKWPWLAQAVPAGHALVRMSVGRYGDPPERWSQLDDDELAARAVADWMSITRRSDTVATAHVQRWTQALPQYLPGHLDAAADIDAILPGLPGLGLAGSAYQGVGIPACIGRATAEVRRLDAAA